MLFKLTDKLGRCPRCMRTAFLVAALAVAAAALASAFGPGPFALGFTVLAGLTTGLWLAHLAAFAARAAAAHCPETNAAAAPRRIVLGRFAALFGAAAAVSALPVAFGQALAASPCQNCQGCAACCLCYQRQCSNACGATDITCVNKCNKAWEACKEQGHC